VYNPSKNADIIAMIGGKPVSEGNNFNASNVRVQVLNGSGVSGIAAKAKEMLEAKGFKVVSIGNISGTKFNASHIIDRTIKGGAAKHVASELDIGSIKTEQDNASKIDVVVILGLDKENIID
jgi:thymidylate kinase